MRGTPIRVDGCALVVHNSEGPRRLGYKASTFNPSIAARNFPQRDDGDRAADGFVEIETHDPRFPHSRMLGVVDAGHSVDRDFGTS